MEKSPEKKEEKPIIEPVKPASIKNWVILILIVLIIVVIGYTYRSSVNNDEITTATITDVDEIVEDSSIEPIIEESDLSEEPTSEEIVIDLVQEEEPPQEEAAPVEETEPTETQSDSVTFTVKEGELVNLKINTQDEDNDEITITYSQPLDSEGKWQTSQGDSGKYPITITVSDGTSETSQDIILIVESTNSAPVLEPINDITVNEGETITITPVASDPDNDELKITYSGFMTSNTYTTNFNNAGEYTVTVTVSDGSLEASQEVQIIINNVNRPPTIESITLG